MSADLNSRPWLRGGGGKHVSHFLRVAAHILRQQVAVHVDTSACRTKYDNFHSYIEQTKTLPKELRCRVSEQEFQLCLKHGCIALSDSLNNQQSFCRKRKRNVRLSPTRCSKITCYVAAAGPELETEWPHSGCLLSVDVTLVMYWIPPTRSEITRRLSVEPVFHIARARRLANLQLVQTTALAPPLPPLSAYYPNKWLQQVVIVIEMSFFFPAETGIILFHRSKNHGFKQIHGVRNKTVGKRSSIEISWLRRDCMNGRLRHTCPQDEWSFTGCWHLPITNHPHTTCF